MSNCFEKFNTLKVKLLPPILALCITCCAGPTSKTSLDLEVRSRVLKLKNEMSDKNRVVGRTEAIAIRKKKSVSEGNVSFHPAPERGSGKAVRLHPEGETPEDAWLEDVVGEDEETLSDSSQEVLHFYYLGYQQMSEGRFETAVRTLEHFLEDNPTHVYADRAQFHIAQAYFGAKEYNLSVLAVNALGLHYPYSLKLTEAHELKTRALKKMGLVQESDRGTLRQKGMP